MSCCLNTLCGIPYRTPSSPHILLNCWLLPLSCWLMAAGGAPRTWETLSYSSLSYHLGNVPRRSTGRSNCDSKTPSASQGHRPIISVKFSTENQIPKEQGAQMLSLQVDYLAKITCQTQEFYNSRKWLIFFQKDSLLILHCCCIFAQHQCPHWWTSCPRTEVCNARNYSQIISDIRKNHTLWRAW